MLKAVYDGQDQEVKVGDCLHVPYHGHVRLTKMEIYDHKEWSNFSGVGPCMVVSYVCAETGQVLVEDLAWGKEQRATCNISITNK